MAAIDARRSLLAMAVAMLPLLARADDRASAGTYVYTSSDGLTVIHPSAAASFDLSEDTRIDARYDADVVSAATVDVRTSASIRPFEETRHGGSLALTQALARTAQLAGSYALSISPDYQSHTFGVGGRLEDDVRIHRVGLDLRGAYESVGRAGDLAPAGEALALGGSASWTGVLATWLVADVGAALEWRHGYLESPYRFVAIYGVGSQSVRVPESVPDDRVRAAISAQLRAALADAVFARASYRLHGDDWGIVGHTVDLSFTFELARGWLLTAGGSFLVQRGASFYRGVYPTLPMLPQYRTRDRELAPGFAASAIVALEAPIVDLPEGFRLLVRARAELIERRYFDTPLLPERIDVSTGLTLSAER